MARKNDKHSSQIHKVLKMGLGDAILRLLKVEIRRSFKLGAPTEIALSEIRMIVDTLNLQTIEVGFDCDDDGVPDTVEIFEQSAHTSCCRLMPTDTSRTVKSSSRRKSSRKKAAAPSRKKAPAKPVKKSSGSKK